MIEVLAIISVGVVLLSVGAVMQRRARDGTVTEGEITGTRLVVMKMVVMMAAARVGVAGVGVVARR